MISIRNYLPYKIGGLILIIISSFLTIYTYEYTPTGKYNDSYDIYKLLMPGVLFSIYLVALYHKKYSFLTLIMFFVILLVGYILSLIIGFSSWGFGVPFAGGGGGLLVDRVFHWGKPLYRFTLLGFVAGSIGLMFLLICGEFFAMGIAFGIIITIWQLFIGSECFKAQARWTLQHGKKE